jgi:YbbR domain-containing protein
MFRHDLGLKILSVIVSFVLWLNVVYPLANNPSSFRVFSVSYFGLDTDQFSFAKPPPETVTVSVQGPVDALREMGAYKEDRFKATVRLDNAVAGKAKYRVDLDLSQIPGKGQGLIYTQPPPVEVEIEPKESRDKPVEVEWDHVPTGLDVTDKTVTPETVSIKGSKSDLDRIARIVATVDLKENATKRDYTAPIDLLDKDGRKIQQVEFDKGGQMTQRLEVTPAFVSIQPVLGVAIDKSNVPVSLVWGSPLRHGYSIRDVSCSPSQVEVAGKTNLLRNVSVVRTERIDLSNVTSDRVIRVRLLSPGRGLTMPTRYIDVKVKVSRPPVEAAPAQQPLATPLKPPVVH